MKKFRKVLECHSLYFENLWTGQKIRKKRVKSQKINDFERAGVIGNINFYSEMNANINCQHGRLASRSLWYKNHVHGFSLISNEAPSLPFFCSFFSCAESS